MERCAGQPRKFQSLFCSCLYILRSRLLSRHLSQRADGYLAVIFTAHQHARNGFRLNAVSWNILTIAVLDCCRVDPPF